MVAIHAGPDARLVSNLDHPHAVICRSFSSNKAPRSSAKPHNTFQRQPAVGIPPKSTSPNMATGLQKMRRQLRLRLRVRSFNFHQRHITKRNMDDLLIRWLEQSGHSATQAARLLEVINRQGKTVQTCTNPAVPCSKRAKLTMLTPCLTQAESNVGTFTGKPGFNVWKTISACWHGALGNGPSVAAGASGPKELPEPNVMAADLAKAFQHQQTRAFAEALRMEQRIRPSSQRPICRWLWSPCQMRRSTGRSRSQPAEPSLTPSTQQTHAACSCIGFP